MNKFSSTSLLESSAMSKHTTLLKEASEHNLIKSHTKKSPKRNQLQRNQLHSMMILLSIKVINPFQSK